MVILDIGYANIELSLKAGYRVYDECNKNIMVVLNLLIRHTNNTPRSQRLFSAESLDLDIASTNFMNKTDQITM